MENSKLLVPVVLSIMNNYKEQAEEVLKELKQVESLLDSTSNKDTVVSEKERDKLAKKRLLLQSDLAEKEELLQGFSDIYESRNWTSSCIMRAEMALH